MATVRILDGAAPVITIVGGRLTIGRESGNDYQIDDPKSSRFHAEITGGPEGWFLKDLGSSNGTWVGDDRITRVPLEDGSIFRIGRTRIRFELEVEARDATRVETGWMDPELVEGLDAAAGLFQRTIGGTTTQLAQHNAYLVLLHQLVERSRSAHSRDELFSLLDDAAAEVLEGDRCAVFLPAMVPGTDLGWTLWPPHERRLRSRFGSVPFARTLLREARRRQEPLLCTMRGDMDPTQSMLRAGVRSAMAAPLRVGEEVLALLYVDRLSGLTPFTRADLEFLGAVGNQLAVCMANLSTVARLTAVAGGAAPSPATAVEPRIELVGPSLAGIDGMASRIASGSQPCLIAGQPGTGKDLVARIIHQRSSRALRPLQILTCAGQAVDRLEALLFGSINETRPGVAELADQTTLVIEDVHLLPPSVQTSLVRLIDCGELMRAGDNAVRTVDVRVLATTSEDPRVTTAIRPDLMARLGAVTITLPALSERLGDLDDLTEHLLACIAVRAGHPPRRLSAEVRNAFLRHPWPGNVRQLRQVLEYADLRGEGPIGLAELPETFLAPQAPVQRAPAEGAAFAMVSLAQVERQHILRVLDHCHGNKKAAAELLDIDRSTLYAKLRQYGIS